MTLKKYTSLAVIALIASVWIGCSSKEDREAYDKFYGKGNKERAEAAVVEIQKLKKEVASAPVEAPAPAAAAPATAEATEATEPTKAEEKAAAPAEEAKPAKKAVPAEVTAILNKYACLACHQPYDKIIGPAYVEVAKKKYSVDQIVELVHNPKPEHWPGYPPMAPMAHVPAAEIKVVAKWINSL
mgnify:CR=1 FL=1